MVELSELPFCVHPLIFVIWQSYAIELDVSTSMRKPVYNGSKIFVNCTITDATKSLQFTDMGLFIDSPDLAENIRFHCSYSDGIFVTGDYPPEFLPYGVDLHSYSCSTLSQNQVVNKLTFTVTATPLLEKAELGCSYSIGSRMNFFPERESLHKIRGKFYPLSC